MSDARDIVERLRFEAARSAATADNGNYLCAVTIDQARTAADTIESLADRDRLAARVTELEARPTLDEVLAAAERTQSGIVTNAAPGWFAAAMAKALKEARRG